MEEFINLYERLELDPSLSCQEMETELKKLRKIWKSRLNAPVLEVRQNAEINCKLIEEALVKLTDENKRAAYDYEVRQHKNRKKETEGKSDREKEKNQALDYDDVDSVIELCRQLVEEENANELFRITSNAIKYGIQNDEIFFYYGLTCDFMENYSEAEKAYKLALELSPNHAPYMLKYAELLTNVKRFEEAKDLYFDLYNNGQTRADIVTGLIHCLFELDQEPMASTIIADYIGNNPTDMGFKRLAQKEYLGAIMRVKSTYLYQEPSYEQIEMMLMYAQKANSILPNNRAKEALEEIRALMPKGKFPNRSADNDKKNKPIQNNQEASETSAKLPYASRSNKKNLNLFSILCIVLAFLYPLAGLIFSIITIKQANEPQDRKYWKRGIVALIISSVLLFMLYVIPIMLALLN